MFYFEKFLNKEILKSDKIPVAHFFTTRTFILKTKEEANLMEAEKNIKDIANYFNLKALISPSQRHSANIKLAELNGDFENTDALLLDNENLGIYLNFADCTPIILYDRVKNVAAIAHAGWRGTVDKISAKTVYKMCDIFKSRKEDIIALVGPCICFNCFETSEEIAKNLAKTVSNPLKFIKNDKSYYADLGGINKAQLEEAGVKIVDMAPYCTFHHNDKFFSYRKENKTTNRISAFISLKK